MKDWRSFILQIRAGSAAQEGLAFALGEEAEVLRLEQADLERIRVLRVAAKRVCRDERTEPLSLVGVNEDGGLHRSIPPTRVDLARDRAHAQMHEARTLTATARAIE